MQRRHFLYFIGAWLLSWLLAFLGAVWYARADQVTLRLAIHWAIQTVTTIGYGDVPVTRPAAMNAADVTALLVIPIWGIAVGLFTSWAMSLHLWKAHDQMKQHVTDTAAPPS